MRTRIERKLATLTGAGLFALALLLAGPAQAQFTNHTIGFEAGGFILDRSVGAKSGPDVGINTTLYIEGGFDLYFRVVAGIHEEIATKLNTIGFFPAMGVRYLISEEAFRPYLGLNLAFMHFFNAAYMPDALFSVSPNAGVEYYFQPNTAFGLQGEYHRILVLNETPSSQSGNAFAVVAKILWGF